jgi:glycosyltransferase involved in cell wall biosynthesis
MISDNIKCIFVCNEILPQPWGGIGSYTFAMAKALTQLGVEVKVIGLYPRQHKTDFPFETISVPYWENPFPRRAIPNFMDRLRLHQKIKKITKRPGKWIVEWPDYQGYWFKSNSRAVEVNKIHSPYFLQPQPGIPSWETFWESRQLRYLGNWSSVSHYYINWVCQKLMLEKESFISFIPIDTEIFRPNKDSAFHQGLENFQITFCGNDSIRKHPEVLAKAFSLLACKYPSIQLNFAGNCYLREAEVRSYIPEKFQQHVKFKGLLKDFEVAQLLQQSTVFCLPSEHESFGISWVEAMACGIPVVAGKGSCAEEIITSEAGLFVDSDRPEEVASAIEKLLRDSLLRRQMGEMGRKIVMNRYDSLIVGKKVLDWYELLLKQKYPETKKLFNPVRL